MKAARREIHLTLKQANYDYERIQYNTVVSAGMKMLNALEAVPADAAGARRSAARGPVDPAPRALSGRAAHRRGALWDDLGFAAEFGDLLDAPWPQVDAAALAQDEIELVLQVNGKLRGKLTVPADADARGDRGGRARERRGREARGRRAGEEGDRRAGAARQCRGLSARARAAVARGRRRAATAPSARWSRSRCRRLAGCGFHLRGDVTYAFSTLYVNAPADAPFTAELKRALAGGGTTARRQRRRRAGRSSTSPASPTTSRCCRCRAAGASASTC